MKNIYIGKVAVGSNQKKLADETEKIKSECELAGYKLQHMIFDSYFDEETKEPIFVNTMIFKFQLQMK